MMATAFQCPKFNANQPNLATGWINHKADMENFFLAAGYEKESEKRKVAMLLYSMGTQYRCVFDNFIFAEAKEKETYSVVLVKFDNFFEPKRVTKLYMKNFEDRTQKSGETISQYISNLRDIARYCHFGDTLEAQLCKQISCGVRDPILRDKLWSEDLSLDAIVTKCQLHEQKLTSHKSLQGNEDRAVNRIFPSRGRGRGRDDYRDRQSQRGDYRDRQTQRGDYRDRQTQRGDYRDRQTQRDEYRSSYDNYSHRGRGNYQRRDNYRGNYRDNYRDSYRSGSHSRGRGRGRSYARNVYMNMYDDVDDGYECYDDVDDEHDVVVDNEYVQNDVDENVQNNVDVNDVEQQMNRTYVYHVTNGDDVSKYKKATNHFTEMLETPYMENGVKGCVIFRLDSQAECTVLSEQSYERMKHNVPPLRPSHTNIVAFGNMSVSPLGYTPIDVIVKGTQHRLRCEIVPKVPNLLSSHDSLVLGLLSKAEIHSLVSVDSVEQIVKEYSDVFEGLGKVPGVVSLKVDPDISPVAPPPRPVPAPLRG